MGALSTKSPLKTGADMAPAGCHAPLGHGWDTIVEAYDLFPQGHVIEALETVKERAAADDTNIPIEIGGNWFWVWKSGLRSWPFVLEDNDGRFTIRMRTRAPSYGVMIEYRAAALWSEPGMSGWNDLQRAVMSMIESFCAPKEGGGGPPLVSRADYAFDFYAPDFSEASTPLQFDNWCAHQEVKRRMTSGDFWGRRKIETWTMGSKKGLQLQLYNKSKQISDVHGTDWIAQVHEATADALRLQIYDAIPKDVWRLEIRMGKDWLKRRWDPDDKKRSLRDRKTFVENYYSALQDALNSITLKVPQGDNGDGHVHRRPAHWMWGVASETIRGGLQRPYVARLTTGRRKALAEMGRKQISGSLRSWAVLQSGGCDEDTLEDLLREVQQSVLQDPEHVKKVERADRRYALVDKP